MKRLFTLVLLLVASLAFAQNLPFNTKSAGGGGTAFTGGTLTSDLVMSDGTYINLATGTLANLALRLRLDPNTGVYSNATSSLALVINGLSRVVFTPANVAFNGQVLASSTGAATDLNVQYSFQGDTNTGMYRPAADTIALAAVGQPILHLSQFHVAIGLGASGNGYPVGTTAIGTNALNGNSSAIGNTAFGYYCLYNPNVIGNTGFGYYAGQLVSGSGNTFIGFHSGDSTVNGQVNAASNSIAIGQNTYTTASNQAVIGDANITSFQVGQGGTLVNITPTSTTVTKPLVSTGTTKISCVVGTAQSVPNGASTFITTLGATDFDTLGEQSGATFTVTIPGFYRVTYTAYFDPSAVGLRDVFIYKNGGLVLGGSCAPDTTASVGSYANVSKTFRLAVGDKISPAAFQNSGAPLNVTPYQWEVTWVP